MDDYQRKMLEIEVEVHRARIAELLESLRDLEENLAQVVDPPEEMSRNIDRMRLELKGRRAAFEVGSSHLRSLRAAA
jgi:predicted  nucleic acid-binding Zn-ribbon protein